MEKQYTLKELMELRDEYVASLPDNREYNQYGSKKWFADGATVDFWIWLKQREERLVNA